MKTLACVICAVAIAMAALPRAERVVERFQTGLRENLACTAAVYAVLDGDESEVGYERAVELCPEDPRLPTRAPLFGPVEG
jgi:hypothetical protein